MKYYNLLFVGLIQLSGRTDYKGISEYVASWGLGLIIVLNFTALVALTSLAQIMLNAYILLSFFGLAIYLNVKYYDWNRLTLNKLSLDLQDKFKPNMTSGELLAIFVIIESGLIVPLVTVCRQLFQ